MAQPVAHYDGNYITCYPGSNQSDDGKLNMEFNMARLVTRVTSKNFCTVKPSYELSIVPSNTGRPQIQVGIGQCSINGMDLIMSSSILIAEPETAGDYYLIFKLYRDGSDNVRGDDVYGVTTTFMGVYLTYVTDKPDPLTDKDVLYLGKFHYDGETITDLEEDEDKYGRIWAEDILCKIEDSKHPDITRLNLQELIYKLPDWYVSKEGDVEFGAIDFMATRLTEGSYGIHIQSTDDNNAEFIMKAPILTTEEENNILKVFAKNTGVEINIGKSVITSGTSNNNNLVLNTPNHVELNSEDSIYIWGKTGLTLKAGNDGFAPYLTMSNNAFIVKGSGSTTLEDSSRFTATSVTHTLGKTNIKYDETLKQLSISGLDTDLISVTPNVDFGNDARIHDTLYLGSESTYGREPTYLSSKEWVISNENATTTIKPSSIVIEDSVENNAYIQVGENANTYAKLINNGKIELSSDSENTGITFKDGSSGYKVEIYKTFNENSLNVDADSTKFMGNITATGDIRAKRVYNAVYNDGIEFMEKEDYNENIEAGDVVCFTDNGKVTKIKDCADSYRLAGVVSSEDTYGFVLGGEGLNDNQKVPVALFGRVYVKVDCHVNTGDLLRIMSDGTVSTTNQLDRYTIGRATMPSEDGKVYMKII